MSSVSSRPRLKTVVASPSLLEVTAGCAAIGAVLVSAIRAVCQDRVPSADLTRRAAGQTVREIRPLHEAAAKLEAWDQRAMPVEHQRLNDVNRLKLSTLASLVDTSFVVSQEGIAPQVAELTNASTIESVCSARDNLVRAVKIEHAKVLGHTLVVACQKASIEAGFTSISSGRGLDGTLRVVAMEPGGRALVTEIRAGDERHPGAIETEVVGVSDGSCQPILDRFDKALDDVGVKAEGTSRRWTGGVCELDLAREYVRKKLEPSTASRGSLPQTSSHQSRAGAHRRATPVRARTKQRS